MPRVAQHRLGLLVFSLQLRHDVPATSHATAAVAPSPTMYAVAQWMAVTARAWLAGTWGSSGRRWCVPEPWPDAQPQGLPAAHRNPRRWEGHGGVTSHTVLSWEGNTPACVLAHCHASWEWGDRRPPAETRSDPGLDPLCSHSLLPLQRTWELSFMVPA